MDCLEDALRKHGKPEVFNRDQGSQFTSEAFRDALKSEGIAISMDGPGRACDNTGPRKDCHFRFAPAGLRSRNTDGPNQPVG